MGEFVALLLLGTLVGALIGGLGGGGGVIGIPAFIWLAGVSASEAGTLSLVAVAAAAVIAVILAGLEREISWRWVLVFGLVGVVGALAGSAVASVVDDVVILIAFGAVVIVATVRFLAGVRRESRGHPGGEPPRGDVSRGGAVFAAAGIGAVTGLVGVGGGFLIAPALMRLVRMAPRLAIGTSSAVILFNCLSSLGARVIWGFDIDAAMAIPVLAGAVAGAVIGRFASQRASNATLRYASGALLLICCVAVGASVAQALWTL